MNLEKILQLAVEEHRRQMNEEKSNSADGNLLTSAEIARSVHFTRQDIALIALLLPIMMKQMDRAVMLLWCLSVIGAIIVFI